MSQDQLFLELVKCRRYEEATSMLCCLEETNVVEQETNRTALHYIALMGAEGFLFEFEKRGDVDFGAKDNNGQKAWELAIESATGGNISDYLQNRVVEPIDGSIDSYFLSLVVERKYDEAICILKKVQDINVRDSESGKTALHYSAGMGALGFISELRKRFDIDYSIEDFHGRTPSMCVSGINRELYDLLRELENIPSSERNSRLVLKPLSYLTYDL